MLPPPLSLVTPTASSAGAAAQLASFFFGVQLVELVPLPVTKSFAAKPSVLVVVPAASLTLFIRSDSRTSDGSVQYRSVWYGLSKVLIAPSLAVRFILRFRGTLEEGNQLRSTNLVDVGVMTDDDESIVSCTKCLRRRTKATSVAGRKGRTPLSRGPSPELDT